MSFLDETCENPIRSRNPEEIPIFELAQIALRAGLAPIAADGAAGPAIGRALVSSPGAVSTSRALVGFGDFDNNGHGDIFWRESNDAVTIRDNGQRGSLIRVVLVEPRPRWAADASIRLRHKAASSKNPYGSRVPAANAIYRATVAATRSKEHFIARAAPHSVSWTICIQAWTIARHIEQWEQNKFCICG
ncbi:hypothetical protein IC762_12875 [Bradyrhizobium genosp. L]|uniref:hypothetical protein n=1 Tax=Bradyrhizobium genosp. L TaxID=83637 RepID=UPI0018A280B0|nr:hypothetical protein [Bradyrhizobium genosp. L]QPF87127.1 hypothetical protein IC762_12875 [Bradyrhizobium genosp. L]